MAKHKPNEDKAVRHFEDKLSTAAISSDQGTLERNANIEGASSGGDHKLTVCYNPACPDYRVERVGDSPCRCAKKTALAR